MVIIHQCYRVRDDNAEAVLGAVSLTPLGKGAVAVSHQLMRAGAGDARDLEGVVDVLEHRMMTVFVKMSHQPDGILGVAVVTDGCNLGDGLNRIGCILNECYLHKYSLSLHIVILRIIVEFGLVVARPDTTEQIPNECPVMGFVVVASHIF
jgi:hypothetical protein